MPEPLPYTDSLPPAREDYFLEYPAFGGSASRCRIRVYPLQVLPRLDTAVVLAQPYGCAIVATELPDNPGTSTTNRAELVHWLAWERAGRPALVVFIDHYPNGLDPIADELDRERFAQASFEQEDGGGFVTQPVWIRGTEQGQQFCGVEFRHLPPDAVEALVQGTPAAAEGKAHD